MSISSLLSYFMSNVFKARIFTYFIREILIYNASIVYYVINFYSYLRPVKMYSLHEEKNIKHVRSLTLTYFCERFSFFASKHQIKGMKDIHNLLYITK